MLSDIPYSGKFWRVLNLANWAKTGSKKIWRNFNLANSNELVCAPRRCCWVWERAVEHVYYVCTYVCFVYTTLESSRVSSLVAHARRWLPCVRVKWSKQPKRRPEWRMAETYEVESFVHGHHVFRTACGAPQLESSYILCKRKAIATRMTCMLWRLYAWGHEYTCVRVHVVYVHTRRLLLARI